MRGTGNKSSGAKAVAGAAATKQSMSNSKPPAKRANEEEENVPIKKQRVDNDATSLFRDSGSSETLADTFNCVESHEDAAAEDVKVDDGIKHVTSSLRQGNAVPKFASDDDRSDGHDPLEIDYEAFHYAGEEFMEKVRLLAHEIDVKRGIYPAEFLPSGVGWGTNNAFEKRKDSVLCFSGSKDVCVLRVVGRISGCAFSDSDGTPKRRVHVDVVPWTVNTTNHLRNVMASLSGPPSEASDSLWGDIQISKFMFYSGESPRKFVDVYDGRKGFDCNDRHDENRLIAANLRKFDTVMVEFTLGRRRVDQAEQAVKWAWEKWAVFSELRTVVLIYRPDAPDEDNNDKEGRSSVSV